MSAERYQQLDQIFAEALQLAPDRRDAFVARECGADAALRTEVLSLLAAADESGEFMAKPALDRLSEVIAADGWRFRSGDCIGAYTVLRLLGSGGAGEVWRARDERLGRDVAIKVLLPHFSTDADRLRRFADEARTAGALNHSNILAIYDVGEFRGIPFLVSECLEGESLRTRVGRGAMAVDTAVAIALQVARGLAAAHARGIVHRDLKPDNVFLTSGDAVKILDFGLAKLQLSATGSAPASTQTMTGVIVGTAGYMAPEQVRGEDVDGRADLFALGVMLYEMLGGRRPFTGGSTFETLHAILTFDPPDLADLNPQVPHALADVVRRLLEKTPGARFQSAVDLAWTLERLAGKRADSPAARADARRLLFPARWLRWIPVAAILVLLASAPWWLPGRNVRADDVAHPTRFTWSLPPETGLGSAPVVSPDNHRIAFAGQNDAGSRLFVRDLASLEATAIAGTEGAKQPFWSPDGKWLGFFANGKLMKVAVDGGAPVTICDARDARGGTWSPSGVIVFQGEYRDTALSQVPATGGVARAATLLDVTGPDASHRWPAFLPDGVHFVYQVVSTLDDRRGIYGGSIAAPAAHPGSALFRSSSEAIYVPLPDRDSGLLLTTDGRWIEARPFNPSQLRVTGEARKIDIAAVPSGPHYSALLSASPDILTFAVKEIPSGSHVAIATRSGADPQIWPERELGGFLRVSPDGGRLARTRVDALHGNADIWVDDLVRGTHARVTTSRDLDVLPTWSPDGLRLAYRSGTNAAPTLKVVSADGVGDTQTLPCPRPYCEPTDWSSAGSLIVNVSGGDVWEVPIEPNKPARPLLAESFTERDARVSPNGRWIAYVSDESGRPVVSVRSLSAPPRRYVVSTSGGDQPVWRRDGDELFYVNGQQFLQGVSVRSTADGGLEFGVPRPLQIPRFGERHWGTVYDVSPDGLRVYFPHPGTARPPQEIGILLGWRTLLRQ